jgi:hypothetical protein
VNYSVWLLTTTSWIAAGQYGPMTAPQQTVISSAPIADDARPGLRERLRHLFHRDEYTPQPVRPTAAPYMTTAEPPLLRPTPQPRPLAVTPAAAAARAPAPAPALSVAPTPAPSVPVMASDAVVPQVGKKYQEKVGCAPDYSWVTGQLFYVHADGGRWVIRYTAVDEQDKFGGSIVLAPGTDMRNYREGDLVSVNGKVLSDARTSAHLPGALYQAANISLIERADP